MAKTLVWKKGTSKAKFPAKPQEWQLQKRWKIGMWELKGPDRHGHIFKSVDVKVPVKETGTKDRPRQVFTGTISVKAGIATIT